MNRRVYFIIAILSVVYFLAAKALLIYNQHTIESLGAEVRIDWPTAQLPPCSANVKVNCTLSLNIVAYRQDGAMLTVARALPPTATGVEAIMPEGLYDIWVTASGRDSSGNFTVMLSSIKAIEITREGSKSSDDPAPVDTPAPAGDPTLDKT
jgi:hypothetical protein